MKDSVVKAGRRQAEASRRIAQASAAVMEGLEDRQFLSAVSMPIDLDAFRGSTIHVPITIDDAAGLMSADLEIAYDTQVLDLGDGDVVRGGLMPSSWAMYANPNDSIGLVKLSAFTQGMPMTGGSGTLVDLVFHVPQDAPTGITTLTLTGSLDEVDIDPVTRNMNVIGEAAVNLAMPTDLKAKPGETIRVPVTLDNAAGLTGVNLTITYDTNLLDLANEDVFKGSLFGSNWQMFVNANDAAGNVQLAGFMTGLPMDGGSGTLFELVFHVPANAPSGTTALTFTRNELNEGEIAVQVTQGSVMVMADSTLTIDGDRGGMAANDVIRLQLSETDSSMLNVYFGDSQTPTSYSLAGVNKIVVNGLGGNDQLLIDASHGMPAVSGGIVFNGGAGTDQLSIQHTDNMSIYASDTELVFGGTSVTYNAVEAMGWEPGAGAALTLGGHLAVALDVSANLASLTLKDSAKLSLVEGSNTVLKVASLSIGANATLDLGDNDLIVTATPETKAAVLAAVSAAIKNARGSGAWTGTGLTSSSAKGNKQVGLAVMLNEKDGKAIQTSFAGQAVTNNDILVKYTWNGDVTLDGKVDIDDYFLIDSGFITQQGQYRNGDLNLDSKVDIDDYFLIDSAFIAQTGTLAVNPAPATTGPTAVLKQLFSVKPVL